MTNFHQILAKNRPLSLQKWSTKVLWNSFATARIHFWFLRPPLLTIEFSAKWIEIQQELGRWNRHGRILIFKKCNVFIPAIAQCIIWRCMRKKLEASSVENDAILASLKSISFEKNLVLLQRKSPRLVHMTHVIMQRKIRRITTQNCKDRSLENWLNSYTIAIRY